MLVWIMGYDELFNFISHLSWALDAFTISDSSNSFGSEDTRVLEKLIWFSIYITKNSIIRIPRHHVLDIPDSKKFFTQMELELFQLS